jgi:nitrate reductase cytochrome c-type subunit
LEAVTVGENIRRGLTGKINNVNARKTHCPKGHPYVEGNLVVSKLKVGKRKCLTCEQDRQKRRREAAKPDALKALKQGVVIPVVPMMKGSPYCIQHGAMNMVAPDLYRCLECHIGYDRKLDAAASEGSR